MNVRSRFAGSPSEGQSGGKKRKHPPPPPRRTAKSKRGKKNSRSRDVSSNSESEEDDADVVYDVRINLEFLSSVQLLNHLTVECFTG